jgi:hypothetical protein
LLEKKRLEDFFIDGKPWTLELVLNDSKKYWVADSYNRVLSISNMDVEQTKDICYKTYGRADRH